MKVQLSLEWKTLNKDCYNGLLDPDEHVDAFVTQMNLFTNEDALMCWVFLTTLKGATLYWYTCLPKNLIDSFGTLIKRFRAQYATSRPYHLIAIALANIQQEESRPLHNFMERFSSISIWIKGLSLEVALTSMIIGLKSGPFSNSLCKKPPTTMDELRERVVGFIHMEEMTAFWE